MEYSYRKYRKNSVICLIIRMEASTGNGWHLMFFSPTDKLQRLNNLVHPRVAADYKRWLDAHREEPYVLKEAALLFESGSYQLLDKIIVVSAPEEVRKARVLKRDPHRTVEQFKEIVEKQLPEAEKMQRADYLIVNDDKKPVIPQVLHLHEELIKTWDSLSVP